jgi:hypothetical protein
MFTAPWSRLVRGKQPASRGQSRRQRWPLRVEALEDRLCPSGGYLLVGSVNTDSVLRYDETSGAFADAFVPAQSGGLRNPIGVVFGPDHNLYVTSDGQLGTVNPGHNAILRYDGSTGAFLGAFADDKSLTNPRSILFGPDGNLYVNNKFGTGAVLRFNGTTGGFLDNFVLTGIGGLDDPTGMVFGPDGTNDGKLDLYVGQGTDNSNILRFDGTTGAYKGVFVPSFAGGLHHVGGMVFGSDGNLYVVSQNTGTVLRFEGPGGTNPGAFLGTVVSGVSSPAGLLFGPDGNGDGKLDLYVTGSVSDGKTFDGEVLRYDWKSGAFLNTFVPPASGGLSGAFLMTFTETDPTTLNYDGARTATLLAASTPATSTARPTVGTNSPTAAAVSSWLAQPPAAAAGAASPAVPSAPPADWLQPLLRAAEAALVDQLLANLDPELSLALFVEDLALADGSSAGLTSTNLRG